MGTKGKLGANPPYSTATGQRGSGAPLPPGGPWSPASPQGHSPGSSTHSPSHSHKIPCLPSRCASAPPRVSWGTCGAGPLLGFLPAPEIKAWKGEGTPFPGFQPDTCSGLGPTWSFPSSATLCPPLPHPDYSDPPGHPGSLFHAEPMRESALACAKLHTFTGAGTLLQPQTPHQISRDSSITQM